jgi:hypothetical protein
MDIEGNGLKIVIIAAIVLIGYFAYNTAQTYFGSYLTGGLTALIVGLLLLGGVIGYKELTK